jgi:hypothetical protein
LKRKSFLSKEIENFFLFFLNQNFNKSSNN